MSLSSSFLSDEQFQCSICLDLFNNPSSTPCGHSFCMSCISRYWDGTKVCQCPLCKKTFQKRPDLQINRTLREITEQFKSMKVGGGGGAGGAVKEKRGGRGVGVDGGIPVDVYEELRKKLPRAPLQASASFQTGDPTSATLSPGSRPLGSSVPNESPLANMMQNSAPPPLRDSLPRSGSRRRFTVTGAASSTSLPLCDVHKRGILIYCRTDNVCVCPICAAEDHQDHDTLTVEAEWTERKVRGRRTEQIR